jgi:hypothetical protein
MAFAVLLVVVPARIASAAAWVADFETGDFTQWDGLGGPEWDLGDHFRLVAAPPGGPDTGGYAFEAMVDATATTDNPGQLSLAYLFPSEHASDNRTRAFEGSEAWYRSALYFPADFEPAPDTEWNWVVEWHNWPNTACCANLALSVDTNSDRGPGERLTLRTMGGGSPWFPADVVPVNDWSNPDGAVHYFVGDDQLDREHWYDVLVHVVWSTDPHEGLVEWWLDGEPIVSTHLSTLFWYRDNNEALPGDTPGPGQAYFMLGYYRPAERDGQIDTTHASVIHDEARIGPTLESVGGLGRPEPAPIVSRPRSALTPFPAAH